MSEDVSQGTGVAEEPASVEAPHEQKKKAYIRERKVLVKIIVGSLREHEQKLNSIQAKPGQVKAFKDAVKGLDYKKFKKICKNGQLRLGREVVIFPGVREASQRVTETFHSCITDPVLRSQMKSNKGGEMSDEELANDANLRIVKRIHKSLGESGGTLELTPDVKLDQQNPLEAAPSADQPASKRVRGLGLLPPTYATLSKKEQKKVCDEIKEKLFDVAVGKNDILKQSDSKEATAEFLSAKNDYLDFVFQMEGYDAARSVEKKFHKLVARRIKERKLGTVGKWMAWITGPSALAVLAGTTLTVLKGKVISLLGLSVWYPLYEGAKKLLLRKFTNLERSAQEEGTGFETFKAREQSEILARENKKILAAFLAGIGAIGFTFILNHLGANELVGQAAQWLYEHSGARELVQGIVGTSAFQSLKEFCTSIYQTLTGTTSSPHEVGGAVASVGAPHEALGQTPDVTQAAQAPDIAPPIEPGIVPTDIPIEAQAGDGLTQVMQHLAEQGVTPSWFPQGMDIHSPDAWAQIVHQLGISGNGPIIHTGDTFWFTPDGTLMIDPVGGSPQIAITPSGTLGDFMQSRMRP